MDKITQIFYFKDNVFFVLKIIKYIIYKYLNIFHARKIYTKLYIACVRMCVYSRNTI